MSMRRCNGRRPTQPPTISAWSTCRLAMAGTGSMPRRVTGWARRYRNWRRKTSSRSRRQATAIITTRPSASPIRGLILRCWRLAASGRATLAGHGTTAMAAPITPRRRTSSRSTRSAIRTSLMLSPLAACSPVPAWVAVAPRSKEPARPRPTWPARQRWRRNWRNRCWAVSSTLWSSRIC